MARGERIAIGSIGIGLVVLAMKAAAWWLTGSAALFSDALETVVNVAAGVIALGALRVAAPPADANHPYGHDKAEFFAAVIEGVLIVIAAFSIFQHAWATWRQPQPCGTPGSGLGSTPSTAVNAGWSAVLVRAGRHSLAGASGRWAASVDDVVTSVGVASGVGLAVLTGFLPLDPLLAAVTAVSAVVRHAPDHRRSAA